MAKKYEMVVSIGDARTAELALRTYGLDAKRAGEIIANESDIAIREHGIIPQNSMAPTLIEFFGEQHVDEALEYAYLYLDEFKLTFDEYLNVLQALLEVFRPEEIIISPELIRTFLGNVLGLVTESFIYGGLDTISKAVASLDDETIREMAEPEEDDEDDFEE